MPEPISIDAVVIGRNEGARLVACLTSLQGQVRRVIYVDSVNQPFGFRKEDLKLLTALSSPAAIAVENALLHSTLELMKGE